jgi:hypothetical protein
MSETTLKQKVKKLFSRIILRTMPPCKEVVKIISASLDRDLTVRERIVMKMHLAACRPCVRYLEQSEFLGDAVGRLDESSKESLFSGTLSDQARQRIKDALKASL